MAEMVPSVLLYAQANSLLEELKEAQASGSVKDTSDLIQQLSSVLSNFSERAGRPMLEYEPIDETEPPSSAKTNRFWKRAQKDINILQQQVDLLRAATVFSHNLVATEVMHARNDNARVNSKLKTLQMYSNSMDSSIISFGDTFDSLQSVDVELTPPSQRVSLFSRGHVTLGQAGEMINLSEDASVKVLGTSNGFLGNNQEIEDPTDAPVDPESGERRYTFKAETTDTNNIEAITDDEPNTWLEYERYHIGRPQKLQAQNLNFDYMTTDENGEQTRVDWAEAPNNQILRLGLEFDLGKRRNLNSVDLTPHGLEGNTNYPILVRQIQTSPDGTNWTRVFPTNVWIGNDINLRTARTTDNIVTGRALWAFEARATQYVRVFIEQHHSVQANIGHSYWVLRENPAVRVEGPIPPDTEPTKYLDRPVIGDYIQKREYFTGKRWAIGLRDLLLQQVQYRERSVLVSRPLRVGGLVDRVVLESADIEIPEQYPSDQHWVKFFITPDDGESWYQISRVEDPFLGIPEQISFNDPLHESLRGGAVANYTTDAPVTSIRLKVELTRPTESDEVDFSSTTPILRSYVLKVKRR